MNPQEYAAGLLFLIARVLHEAVERGQKFHAEQSAGMREAEPVLGQDGRLWATCEPDGSYKLILTVEPLAPVQENGQPKVGYAETDRVQAPALT
jgi:hypothetical protein